MAKANLQTATNGSVRVPFDQRDGATSDVLFTRDLSPEGLRRAVAKVAPRLSGKIAIKLHTGEKDGPNIIPFNWVRELVQQDLPDATIVETNTYYEGNRYTTEQHRETIAHNGWTFCPVDIMDEECVATLPVAGGKWFNEMHVGTHMLNYDSMLTLTHFKGHTMGGFGGSNKNLGIGCADGRIGKGEIHTVPGSDNLWSIAEEELMERMTESPRRPSTSLGITSCTSTLCAICRFPATAKAQAPCPSSHRMWEFWHRPTSVPSTPPASIWYTP